MRALALVLGLLAASPAAAAPEGQVGFTVDRWGGLDLYQDSSRISDFDARVASNVVTDRGRLERRGGSLRIGDLSAIGSVKHLMKWRTSDGVDRAIAHVGDYIYSMDFGTAETKVSTVAASATVDGVSGFSRFYFTDASQRLIEYNGTSTTTVPAAPIARYVEFEHERLWAANIPAESGSMVRTSSFGGAAYWTVPADSDEQCDAPDQFYFDQDDGQDISCMAKTPFGIFIGKPNKKTWVIKGVDNCTFRKVLISADAGCVDDRSVRMHEGKLRWADRGTWYEWKGAGPPVPFTQDVEPMVETLRQAENLSGTLTTDTQAEFESGNLTASGAGAPISSTIEAGAITVSSNVLVEDTAAEFGLGTCAGCGADVRGQMSFAGVTSTYVFRYDANALPDSDGWTNSLIGSPSPSVSGGSLTVRTDSSDGGYYKRETSATDVSKFMVFRVATRRSGSDLCAFGFGTTDGDFSSANIQVDNSNVYYRIGGATVLTEAVAQPSFSTFTVIVTSDNVAHFWRNGTFKASGSAASIHSLASHAIIFAGAPLSGDSYIWLDFLHYSTGVPNPGTADIVSVATFTAAIFNTTFSTPTLRLIASSSPVSGTTLSFSARASTSPNNDFWNDYLSVKNETWPSTYTKQYVQHRATFTHLNFVEAPGFSITIVAKTTATYRSPVNFVNSAVSGWGAFTATQDSANGGVATYYTRASNTVFDKDASSPAWFTQVNLSSVQAPAGQYSQWRVDYALSSASSTVTTSRVQYEYLGDSVGPVASLVFDRRYLLCGSFYGADAYSCLFYQRNNKFVVVDGPGYISLLDFGEYAIAGSSTGYVWKILVDGLYNDDGAAIESTWVSRDFMFAPNGRDWAVGQKSFNELWIDASVSSGTILTAGYSLNKSTSYTTGDLDLGAWGDHVNKMVPFTTGYGLGKYVGFRFTNAQINKFFDIVGYSVYGVPQEKTLD